MENQDKENLKKLVESFYQGKQADQVLFDLEQGEKLLDNLVEVKCPAETADAVKVNLRLAIRRNKTRNFRIALGKAVAVAAVFIMTISLMVNYYNQQGQQAGAETNVASNIIRSELWDSKDIVADDMELSVLTAEINELEDELLALKYEGKSTNRSTDVVDIEIELYEINNQFWEG